MMRRLPMLALCYCGLPAYGQRAHRCTRAGWSPDICCTPQGAEEASGIPDMIRVTREQAGRGADWIKIYADYRWGPDGSTQPTFSEEELRAAVETAHSSGRPVAVHAARAEGMGRAVL